MGDDFGKIFDKKGHPEISRPNMGFVEPTNLFLTRTSKSLFRLWVLYVVLHAKDLSKISCLAYYT